MKANENNERLTTNQTETFCSSFDTRSSLDNLRAKQPTHTNTQTKTVKKSQGEQDNNKTKTTRRIHASQAAPLRARKKR